jgi:hypothetical protein
MSGAVRWRNTIPGSDDSPGLLHDENWFENSRKKMF